MSTQAPSSSSSAAEATEWLLLPTASSALPSTSRLSRFLSTSSHHLYQLERHHYQQQSQQQHKQFDQQIEKEMKEWKEKEMGERRKEEGRGKGKGKGKGKEKGEEEEEEEEEKEERGRRVKFAVDATERERMEEEGEYGKEEDDEMHDEEEEEDEEELNEEGMETKLEEEKIEILPHLQLASNVPAPLSQISPSPGPASSTSSTSSSSTLSSTDLPDSDDEFGSEPKLRITEQDPFYDESLDQQDQQWVQQRIAAERSRQSKPKSHPLPSSTSISAPLPPTTASSASSSSGFLSCPSCFTSLCLDFQRHIDRPHQFRAMFVLSNCKINTQQLVKPIPNQRKQTKKQMGRRKGRRNGGMGEGQGEGAEAAAAGAGAAEEDGEQVEEDGIYWAVECDTCSARVGVYDEEEIYHFFNVLESS